jgi:deoxycytidine triphosphate deaminase
MILSDGEIKKRVASQKLIEGHDPEKIKYCGCELTLGRMVSPKTGKVHSVIPERRSWLSGVLTSSKFFWLEPSETMILVTKEKLNMPSDLCATYGQLNRLANLGLIILNTSIVEPGYAGPLSCVLVNFSSQKHGLSPGDPIAKLNFHTIEGTPIKQLTDNFTHEDYEQLVSKNSTHLPKSLLDISGVEERVTEKVTGSVKKSLVFGGIFLAILVLWSQLEGFFSEWIHKRTGFVDTKFQIERAVDDRLTKQQADYQKQNDELKRQILDLQNLINNRNRPKGTTRDGPAR